MTSAAPGSEFTNLTPTAPSERAAVIDALRGFALPGILLVNMELFAHPIQTLLFPRNPALPVLDRVAPWLVRLFGEGKFYSLFSTRFPKPSDPPWHSNHPHSCGCPPVDVRNAGPKVIVATQRINHTAGNAPGVF